MLCPEKLELDIIYQGHGGCWSSQKQFGVSARDKLIGMSLRQQRKWRPQVHMFLEENCCKWKHGKCEW